MLHVLLLVACRPDQRVANPPGGSVDTGSSSSATTVPTTPTTPERETETDVPFVRVTESLEFFVDLNVFDGDGDGAADLVLAARQGGGTGVGHVSIIHGVDAMAGGDAHALAWWTLRSTDGEVGPTAPWSLEPPALVSGSDRLSVWSTGAALPSRSHPFGSLAMAPLGDADLDDDGVADLVVSGLEDAAPNNGVRVYFGGQIDPADSLLLTAATGPDGRNDRGAVTDAVTLDLDGDGSQDLAGVDGSAVAVLAGPLAPGVGRLETVADLVDIGSRGDGPYDLVEGDLDGDGRPSVLVGTPEDCLLAIDGPSAAGAVPLVSGCAHASAWAGPSVAVGDLDGDGAQDVVLGEYANDAPGTLRVWLAPELPLAFDDHDHRVDGERFGRSIGGPWSLFAHADLDGLPGTELVVRVEPRAPDGPGGALILTYDDL